MPSAMSRPSDPVEMVSMSIDLGFLPSFMIEPLPKLRSIWDSAASRAFDLSMELPSTRRNAAGAMSLLLMTTIRRADNEKALRRGGVGPSKANVHDLFFVRNMFFSRKRGIKTGFGPEIWCWLAIAECRGGGAMPAIGERDAPRWQTTRAAGDAA